MNVREVSRSHPEDLQGSVTVMNSDTGHCVTVHYDENNDSYEGATSYEDAYRCARRELQENCNA